MCWPQVIITVTDGCALMKYCTRFTEEIFSGLISLIFIFKEQQSVEAGVERI